MSMSEFPVRYIEPVFRPPSEAHSLILPVTNGCSWERLHVLRDVHRAAEEIPRPR